MLDRAADTINQRQLAEFQARCDHVLEQLDRLSVAVRDVRTVVDTLVLVAGCEALLAGEFPRS